MKQLLTITLLITCSLGAMEFKEPGQQIRLLCGDKKEVVTSLDLMKEHSGAIRMLLEDINPAECAIPLPNVDSKILTVIIDHLLHKHDTSISTASELKQLTQAIRYLDMPTLAQKMQEQKPDTVILSCDKTRAENIYCFGYTSDIQENIPLPRALCEKSGTIRDLLETKGTFASLIPMPISSEIVATIFNCLEHPENAERIIAELKAQKLLDFTQAILYLDILELFEKLPAVQWALRLPLQAINLCKAYDLTASRDHSITVTYYGRDVHIRDTQSGKILKTLSHPDIIRKILLSHDNQQIITSCDDNIVRIWDTQSCKILKTLKHPKRAWKIILSHNNQQIITGCWDNIVRIWDTQSGNILQTFPHPNDIFEIILSDDEQWVITSCKDNIVRIWDRQSGNILQSLPHPNDIFEIILSDDEQWVITGCNDNIVRIWDAHSGNILQTLSHPRDVLEILLIHDKQQIITSCLDGNVRIWDRQAGSILQILSHPRGVNVMLSHDKQWIITSCYDNIVRIWDIQSGILQTLSHPNYVREILLSYDDQWIITKCDDKIVRIWDIQSGNILQTLSHPNYVWQLLFSHDNKQIITSSLDHIVRMWPLKRAEILRSLHFNHLLLITKIYEQAMKGSKLDLTSAASDELRTIFESLPIHIKNTLECFVILPQTSIWGYLKTAARFFTPKVQPKK